MIVNVVERCACNQGLVSVLDCIPSHFHSSKFASSALKPQFIFAKLIFIKVMLGQRFNIQYSRGYIQYYRFCRGAILKQLAMIPFEK